MSLVDHSGYSRDNPKELVMAENLNDFLCSVGDGEELNFTSHESVGYF